MCDQRTYEPFERLFRVQNVYLLVNIFKYYGLLFLYLIRLVLTSVFSWLVCVHAQEVVFSVWLKEWKDCLVPKKPKPNCTNLLLLPGMNSEQIKHEIASL